MWTRTATEVVASSKPRLFRGASPRCLLGTQWARVEKISTDDRIYLVLSSYDVIWLRTLATERILQEKAFGQILTNFGPPLQNLRETFVAWLARTMIDRTKITRSIEIMYNCDLITVIVTATTHVSMKSE